MAKDEPDKRTSTEKEESAVNLLCQSITTSAAYSALKARIYERMGSTTASSGYDISSKAAIDLGAFKSAQILFTVLEENTITPSKPQPPSDAY